MEDLNIRDMLMNDLQRYDTDEDQSNETDGADTENPIAGKTYLLIGQDDKRKGRNSVLVIQPEKVNYLDSERQSDEIIVYDFTFTTGRLYKNSQEILNQPQQTMKRLIREFQERNKNIKVFRPKGEM